MKAALVLISLALALAGCERDHPEAFVKPNAGSYDKISMYPPDADERGFLGAQGIWTIDGDDRIATPINVSRIECNRADELCMDYRANLMNVNGTVFLNQDSDLYLLKSWEDGQVVAVSEDGCRTIELRIDTVAQTVMTVTGNTPGIPSCNDMPKPRISRLIAQRELEEIQKAGGF